MIATLILLSAFGQVASANVRPQIGYVYPPGGKAGSTLEVQLGTYDWTPDMQLFPHDPRIKLEIMGPAGDPILTPPPYWFGAKAGQAQPPLPREVPARITIPADFPPGVFRWQAANANGGTNVGTFVVSDVSEVVEPEPQPSPLDLPALPVAVSGRVSKITEIDSYRFSVADAGLVVCKLDDRLGQPFHGVLAIHDAAGRKIADSADTAGVGTTVLFTAQAGATYVARVHDLEYGGDRGYVYRLSLARGPHVVATLPLVVKPGFSGAVEVVGWGVATGQQVLEAATPTITVPADAAGESFGFSFDTPAGRATAMIALGDVSDSPEPAALDIAARQIAAPASIAGRLDAVDPASNMPIDRYQFTAKKGDVLRLAAEAQGFGSPVDPSLAISGPDGKEIARNDDVPGGTDAVIAFTAPTDGEYQVSVTDFSGTPPSRGSTYRLSVENPAIVADFKLQLPERLDVPLGGKLDLPVKAIRLGDWKAPITLRLEGLPDGVSPAPEMTIQEGKNDLNVALNASDQAAATASLVTVVASATAGDRTLERRSTPVLVSTTLKPRCQIQSAVQDGGRLVNRGTTYPADVIIQRLEGYTGPVTLQMAAAQQRQRRGMRAAPLVVAAGATTTQYPIFMPEWLETNLTCRMNVVGVTEVPDPKGNVRHVIGNMDGLIVMSLEGGLLKLSHEPAERVVRPGDLVEIPVRLSRSAKLPAAAKIELVPEGELAALITAAPIDLPADQSAATIKLQLANDAQLVGQRTITLRATAMQDGRWPALSETQVSLVIERTAAAEQSPK